MESDKIRLFCFFLSEISLKIFNLDLDLRGKSAAQLYNLTKLDDALPTDTWGCTIFLDTFRIHRRS
jgi:hypothetical protein